MKIDREQWSRLSALLDAALDLDAGQRESWLSQLSGEAAALREPLRTLLAQHARVDTHDFLKAPDFAGALLMESARAQQPPQELEAQAELGMYRLLRELGRGGMGSVWLAERTDGKLKRQVALKIPYAGPHQRELAARLARERDILAGLEHPNIARLYDADVTAQGQPFLVLEYVDGIPIREFCERRQLALRAQLALFLQVLGAVQYAHTHLVIHRDLKPSNILITSEGIARLLDFGIAKLVSEGEARETALTQFGGRALTPDYASPEQVSGQLVTTASDVYSLGVVLYELLTGNRPYRPKRDTRASLEDAIAEADVVAPSRATTDSGVARQLRGDLDTIVLKALRKDPKERYVSVDALRRDLERSLNSEPVDARPHSRRYLFGKLVARNKLAFGAAGVVLASLIFGIGAATWQAARARASEQHAIAEAKTSEAVKQFMIRIFQTNTARQADPMKARQQSALELLEAGADRVGVEFKDDPALHRELLTVILALLGESRSDTYGKHARELLQLLKDVPGSKLQRADLYANLSITRQGKDSAEAVALAKQGLAVLGTPADAAERKQRAVLLNALAYLEMNTDADAAIAKLLEARALLAAQPTKTAEYADSLVLLGTLENRRDHVAAAIAYFEEALDVYTHDPTVYDKSIARGHYYLAMGYLARKQYAAAERELRLASALFEKTYGAVDPQTAFNNARLASVIAAQNRFDDALALLHPALAVLETRSPAFNSDYFKAGLGHLAATLVKAGRLQEAAPAVQRMLGASTDDPPLYRADPLFTASDFELMRGEDANAELHARQAVAFATEGFGATGARTLGYKVSLGRTLLTLGKVGEADALLTAVMHDDAAKAGEFNSAWTRASVQHARAQAAHGDTGPAIAGLNVALTKFLTQPADQRDLNEEQELHTELGRELMDTGRAPEAVPHLERALALRATQYATSPRLAEAQVLLADCLLRSGDLAASRALLAKAQAIYAANKKLSSRYARSYQQVNARLALATKQQKSQA